MPKLSKPLHINWREHRHVSWGNLRQEARDVLPQLDKFLEGRDVCPDEDRIFEAFTQPLGRVRVVILGQDPYHTDRMATGLAFAVPKTTRSTDHPLSLRTIFHEVDDDFQEDLPRSSDLAAWAYQGVLLLNTALTVDRGKRKAGTHLGKGWEAFTNGAIELVSGECSNVVFCLWGREAWRAAEHIDRRKHDVLLAGHPRAQSTALVQFSGCRHFSQVNRLLGPRRQIVW